MLNLEVHRGMDVPGGRGSVLWFHDNLKNKGDAP